MRKKQRSLPSRFWHGVHVEAVRIPHMHARPDRLQMFSIAVQRIILDVRSLYDANQGDGSIKVTLTVGFVLLSVLVGSQSFAQAVDQPARHVDGKSLSNPEHERAAKDAMNTPSGQMGRDEPGTHELR